MEVADGKRIKSLDGLRGIAILLVLSFHLFNVGFLYPFFSLGWMGVELFFVLSGFLITGILLDTKFEPNFIKSFLVRRALRTLPLYYAVLIIFAIAAPYFSPTKWFAEYQLFFWTHTSNFLSALRGHFRPLGHFWSLAIEEQFYLFWPFVVLILTPKRLIGLSVFLIALGIFLRSFSPASNLILAIPFKHLDAILIGAITAVLVRAKPALLFANIEKIFAVCAIVFVGFVIINIDPHGWVLTNPLTLTVTAIFFGSVMIMSIKSSFIESLLANKFLLFFGKYSYGMYVFNSILYHLSNWAGADRLTANQKLIPYTGVLVLTVVLSYLSYNLFEVKFLQLKNRLSPKKLVLTSPKSATENNMAPKSVAGGVYDG
jgi:peptidoglycan/LPS O-acetylase OafA/YrhL